MKKIFTLLLSLSLLTGLQAQMDNNKLFRSTHDDALLSGAKTITFSADSVQYWVGSGSNSAVFIIGWDTETTPVAHAWGVHWSGSAVALDLIDTLCTHDPRLSYDFSGSFLNYIHYDDTATGEHYGQDGYFCYMVNGTWASAYNAQTVVNGDVIEVSAGCMFELTTCIPATNPFGTTDDDTVATVADATINSADIVYWIGNGNRHAILAVNWADTCLAWGLRFDDNSTSLQAMMDSIAAADWRFSYTISSTFVNDILFVQEDGETLSLDTTTGNYWWSNLNGTSANGLATVINNGDFVKWGDVSVGIVTDSAYGYPSAFAFTTPVTPVTVPGIPDTPTLDATIDSADIVYWIGNGNRHAILAVNWADTCLAWGLRFDDDSITARQLMDAVAAADWRFSYTAAGFVNDIHYMAGDRTLGLATVEEGYNYWWSNLNGTAGMGLADILHHGDLLKWGDISVATGYDYDEVNGYYAQYAFLDTVLPVDVPQGLFCGIVGTEGCDAIPADSDKIKAWATGCTVTRGWENIATQERLVSYGHDSMAVGAVTMNDNLSVVSLGDGGSAILSFANPITNGEGPDFAIFENSFDDYFLELAFVEVSSDGERFVRFPARSLTQTYTQIGSIGHVDATFIHNLAGKYRMGYGTPFDLAELADSTGLDINRITHVRIVDVVGSIDPHYASYDAMGRIINDPFPTDSYSTGFDLDGIGVLNQTDEISITVAAAVELTAWPSPSTGLLQVRLVGNVSNTPLCIYDMMGRKVLSMAVQEGTQQLDLRQLPKGVYLLSLQGTSQKIVLR